MIILVVCSVRCRPPPVFGQPELLTDCVEGRGHLGETAGGALALGQPRVTNLRQKCGHESHDVRPQIVTLMIGMFQLVSASITSC